MQMDSKCKHCGTQYSRPASQIGSYCSKTCWHADQRKDENTSRRIRYLPEHPLAGATGLVAEARAVLYEQIGPGEHPCHWCGTKVRWMTGLRGNLAGSLIADHLNGDPLNDAADNIVPACGRCNGTRTQQIKPDEAFVVRSNGTRTRAVERACIMCGGAFFVPPAALKRPNRGLFCSRSCARKKAATT